MVAQAVTDCLCFLIFSLLKIRCVNEGSALCVQRASVVQKSGVGSMQQAAVDLIGRCLSSRAVDRAIGKNCRYSPIYNVCVPVLYTISLQKLMC